MFSYIEKNGVFVNTKFIISSHFSSVSKINFSIFFGNKIISPIFPLEFPLKLLLKTSINPDFLNLFSSYIIFKQQILPI